MRSGLLVLVLLSACKSSDSTPLGTLVDAAPARVAAPVARPLPIVERPLGPTRAACEKLVAHVGEAMMKQNAAVANNADQRAYAERFLAQLAPRGLGYCLQVASPREVECLILGGSREEMAACERHRRELPPEMLERNQVAPEDCARFYDRLRQFKIEEEGADPVELDRSRDQILRACNEKSSLGTITCFIASPSYAQARRCP